jgi:hypothetical protein
MGKSKVRPHTSKRRIPPARCALNQRDQNNLPPELEANCWYGYWGQIYVVLGMSATQY